MLAGSALRVAVTLAAWVALVSVGGLSVAGFNLAPAVRVACAAIAGPIALAAGVGALSGVWRGPRVIAFERANAVPCGAAQAEAIRAGARLRGTMGGAGHLHPARLAFPAAACLAAVVCGVEGVSSLALEIAGPWPFSIAVSAVIAAWLFPSQPYWYREITGGGVLVSPPAAAAALVAAQALRRDASAA